MLINHLMYADDLVIMCPYSRDLARLLKICSKYGIKNDIRYNSTKSVVMIISSKQHKMLAVPKFHLNGMELLVNKETVYLGYFIIEDFRDDRDIQRQCRNLYSQGNMLVRKFSMCSPNAKVSLFRTFCTPMYTAQLWCNFYAYSENKLRIVYNYIMRMLLGLQWCHSASQMFANINVPAYQADIRNLIFKFMCRLDKSENDIIQGVCKRGPLNDFQGKT